MPKTQSRKASPLSMTLPKLQLLPIVRSKSSTLHLSYLTIVMNSLVLVGP